jgi:hypothetical protein
MFLSLESMVGNYSTSPFQLFLSPFGWHYSREEKSPSGDRLMQVRRREIQLGKNPF